MKVNFLILTGGLFLPLLLTVTACDRDEGAKSSPGNIKGLHLKIGVYPDPQNSSKCKVSSAKTIVRLSDTVTWEADGGVNFTIHFPNGSPFGSGVDKFNDGQETPKPQASSVGTYYVYDVFLNSAQDTACKSANDPNDPGLDIKK